MKKCWPLGRLYENIPIVKLKPWCSSHDLSRYQCANCHKTCNPLTKSPLARLRKRDKWLVYAQALIDGLSIRKAAELCGVNKNTAFQWRHRFLALANNHQAKHGGALSPLVDSDAILCTDGARVYASFCKKAGIKHEVIHSKGSRARGVFHIQNVNAFNRRLKGWMKRFNGVAAKYLSNYLGWRRLLERHQAEITPDIFLFDALSRTPQQLIKT